MKKSSKKAPVAPRGKGRFGFITVVFLMVGAAILLTVSAGNRHAMVAWGELPHEKSSGEPEVQDSRFILIDVSDTKPELHEDLDVRDEASSPGNRVFVPDDVDAAFAETGAPAWLKPLKFAVSIGVYSATFAWVVRALTDAPRLARLAVTTTVAALIAEMALIGLQAARGTTSHFNTSTLFDGAVFKLPEGWLARAGKNLGDALAGHALHGGVN